MCIRDSIISDRRTKGHNTPSLREGWGELHIIPNPSPWEGSVDGWGKYGLKGQYKSAQGNALGIVRNQHSPRMGKRIIIPLTPFATLQWWAVILLPPSGAFPCCILSPRALPGADISMPLRGVTNTHPVPILRQAKRLRRLPERSSPARTLFACMSKNP